MQMLIVFFRGLLRGVAFATGSSNIHCAYPMPPFPRTAIGKRLARIELSIFGSRVPNESRYEPKNFLVIRSTTALVCWSDKCA
jgi:hypothetical protein